MYSRFLSFVLLLFLIGCSGISIINDQYSKAFLKKIEETKVLYKQGDNQAATKNLREINDKTLSPAEKAMKYNLMGVIAFSQYQYDVAIKLFSRALETADADENLKAQIKLNMASSFFKQKKYRKSFRFVESINYKRLSPQEASKHHNLSYVLAQQLGDLPVATKSLMLMTLNSKTFQDFRNSSHSETLIDNFFKLSSSQRMRLLEEFEGSKAANIAFLAKMEAEKRYFAGDKGEAKDIINWMKTYFSNLEEVKLFTENFSFKIENFSKIQAGSIGVILPLSGRKSQYGKKALKGIDAALSDVVKSNKSLRPNIFTKDSYDSPIAGELAVRELVEKHFVSVIIGGLFPDSAKKEYLEAKKYGVVYISLSPIHLPKDEKNHLLIEVPGSVESQINAALSEKMFQKFGNKVALLYPESDGGEAYVNEHWRRTKGNKLELKNIHSYKKNITDYRDSVGKLLGLEFKRERKEEYEIWSEIYKLQGRTNVRRINILKPVVDFDWVYLPAYPHEALQIIPAFNYYDASNIAFIGGPSWRSRTLIREQRELGKVIFMGDNPDYMDPQFRSRFYKKYKKTPRLIETLAYDGLFLGNRIVTSLNIDSRDQLEINLKNQKSLKGLTGIWRMSEGIWLKEMVPLKIEKGKISKLFPAPGEEKVN